MKRQLSTSDTQPSSTNRSRGIVMVLIIALATLVVAGASYSIYAWQQNESKSQKIKELNSRVASLSSKLESIEEIDQEDGLKRGEEPDKHRSQSDSGADRIYFKDVGISLPSSDTLRSLTYVVTINQSGAVIDAATTEFGALCKLGRISKGPGIRPKESPAVNNVKQLDDAHIIYAAYPGPSCEGGESTDSRRKELSEEVSRSIDGADLIR